MICCVLLCTLKVLELLEVPDVIPTLFAGRTGGDALCAVLYAGGRGGWALFVGGAGGDTRVLLCMRETMEDDLCLLEVPEVMRRVLLCMLEAVEGQLCLREVLEVIRCVLLYMLETVEDGLCLLEMLAALDVLDVPDVMRCVLLCSLEAVEDDLCLHRGTGGTVRTGGDTLCVTLYSGGCGG